MTSRAPRSRLVLLLLVVALPPLLVVMGVGTEPRWIGAGASEVLLDSSWERRMAAQELEQGRLPMWNPHTMCGFPQIASMESGALYPVGMLIGRAVAPDAIWYWTVIVHGALLALFAFLWLEHGLGRAPVAAFAGAAIVALSGFFFLRVFAGQIAAISALPWLLAVLWRLERALAAPSPRATVALALCVAMLVFAGYPLFLLHAALIAAFRGAWRLVSGGEGAARGVVTATAGFVVGAALGAPQLLPALELHSLAHRFQVDPSLATQLSLAPESLLTMLAPAALGDGVTLESAYWGRWLAWESSAFFGVTALVLAILGALFDRRRCIPWLILAVAAMLLALGRHAPILEHVPGIRSFHAPNRHVLIAILAIAAAASAAIERLGGGASQRFARIAGVTLTVVALAAGTVWALGDSLPDGWWRAIHGLANEPAERAAPLPDTDAFRAGTLAFFARALGATALFTAAAGVTLLVMARRRAAAATGALALALVVTCELIGGGFRYLTDQSNPRAPQAWAEGVEAHLSRGAPLGRIVSAVDVRDVGRCEVAGFDHVGGYDRLMLSRYGELMNAIAGKSPDAPIFVAGHDWPPLAHPAGVVRLLGVRHRIAEGRPDAGPVPARQFPRATIYDVSDALPRAFVVGSAEVVADRRARLTRLTDEGFDPTRAVILETEPKVRHPLAGPTTVTTRRLDDDRTYEMDIEGPGGGFLVFAESTYPGWTCTIDGQPAEILVADHAFQAVALPPGARAASFRFTSRPMMGGTWISVVTALLLVGWLFLASRRSKTEPNR